MPLCLSSLPARADVLACLDAFAGTEPLASLDTLASLDALVGVDPLAALPAADAVRSGVPEAAHVGFE